jgi:hypothetical protein
MRNKFILFLFPCILFLLYIVTSSYSGGIVGSATGCSCHGVASNNTIVTLSGLPSSGYVNGVTYTLTLSVTNTVILPATGGGTFGLRDGFNLFCSGGTLGLGGGTGMALSGVTDLRHTTAKAPVAGTASWTFVWTAPAAGGSTIFFNMAGNATNGNGNTNGDQWKFTTVNVTQAIPPLSVTATAGSILCNGNFTTITASGSGGSGTLQYKVNAGAYQSSNTFTNISSGTYTVLVKDATNATSSTALNITQPSALNFSSASTIITNPVCNGGFGSISTLINGGVGTKTYSITPSGPQTNTIGNFTNLLAQTYTVTGRDQNNCSIITSFVITNPPPLNVAAANVSGCEGQSISLIGSPLGGTFSVSNPYIGPSTTYTYSYTNSNGCTGISLPANIAVTPVNTSYISTSLTGNTCASLTPIGNTKFANSACELITQLNASGIGNTTACVSFLPGTPTWNGEPYASRVYSIQSTLQPSVPVNVCLYYTNAELLACGITSNADISITKVGGNGILGGTGIVTEIPNTSLIINTLSGGIVEVCFNTLSFSSFYLHSKNPLNAPLAVTLSKFDAQEKNKNDLIVWETSSEYQNKEFLIEHSKDGKNFTWIHTEASKATLGNSTTILQYSYMNELVVQGANYYRLKAIDIDGISTYSSIIKTMHDNAFFVRIYPNPSSEIFYIESDKAVHYWLMNMQGSIIQQERNIYSRSLLIPKSGIYFLRIADEAGNEYVEKLVVE